MTDHWPNLHSDPYALARLRKSVEIGNILSNHSVLDIGCHQEEARQFIPAGCSYVGLDHLKGDDFDGGFSIHQKFDRILCLEVLEHLQWPRKTLKSITEHLSNDGIVVISLPNESSIFHRFRAMLGTVDQECFSECGKHVHLPSLRQARELITSQLLIVSESYYISKAEGCRQLWIQTLLRLIPDWLLQAIADSWPSLFARGFIFVCRKK